jgi:hypothetical protein
MLLNGRCLPMDLVAYQILAYEEFAIKEPVTKGVDGLTRNSSAVDINRVRLRSSLRNVPLCGCSMEFYSNGDFQTCRVVSRHRLNGALVKADHCDPEDLSLSI